MNRRLFLQFTAALSVVAVIPQIASGAPSQPSGDQDGTLALAPDLYEKQLTSSYLIGLSVVANRPCWVDLLCDDQLIFRSSCFAPGIIQTCDMFRFGGTPRINGAVSLCANTECMGVIRTISDSTPLNMMDFATAQTRRTTLIARFSPQ
jgi:hypothetical protein